MVGELSEHQINNILSSQVVGRLACTTGKQPYIVPITYTYDGQNIYGQTRDGLKLQILRKNPNVCFEIDIMTDLAHWQSVVVYGEFEELNGDDAQQAREVLFDRVYPMQTRNIIHAHEHAVTSEVDDSNRIKPVMFRIRISKKTGRFERK